MKFCLRSVRYTYYLNPKKDHPIKRVLVTLHARITASGRRSEFILGRRIEAKRWCKVGGKLRGPTRKVNDFNLCLDQVQSRCYEIHNQFLKNREPISAQALTDSYLGKGANQWMLLEIFQNHNEGFSSGTLQGYKTGLKHCQHFVSFKYNRKDLPLENVNHKFITGFEYFSKFNKKSGHNSAVKYIINLKKIIRIAYANQWISRDPFFHWKVSWKTRERKIY